MTPDDVAAIVRELLDSDDVAVDDSFFDSGGNSMTALTLISRLRRMSGVSLSLIDIVHSPTPAGIARLIEDAGDQRAEAV